MANVTMRSHFVGLDSAVLDCLVDDIVVVAEEVVEEEIEVAEDDPRPLELECGLEMKRGAVLTQLGKHVASW